MRTLLCNYLRLEPLEVKHAEGMFDVLSDPNLYEHLDYGPPESVEYLRSVYRRLERRHSPDGTEQWLNWVAIFQDRPIGFVQATVLPSGQSWVAYVFQRKTAGRGLARSAVGAMLEDLAASYGVLQFLACVEEKNFRSIRLLQALCFTPADPVLLAQHELSSTERLYVAAPNAA